MLKVLKSSKLVASLTYVEVDGLTYKRSNNHFPLKNTSTDQAQ